MNNNKNSGHCNSGNRNLGNCNSGDCNSGNLNSGHYNSGNRNSGDRNSGNYNSGHYNSGNRNLGNCNSGDCNSGSFNSGYYNSGNRNSGNYNSGNYNSGNNNSGFFCTETPKVKFFDIETNLTYEEAIELIPYVHLNLGSEFVYENEMTVQEKKDNPNYKINGGYTKKINKKIQEVFPEIWKTLNKTIKDKFLNLPNFDANKFFKCTGVDVTKETTNTCIENKRIVIDGKTYKLVLE